MESESILDEFCANQGWNTDTALTLALEYINQGDNSAWEDFLRVRADEENAEIDEENAE
jgi:hypothetical protein